MCNFSLPRWPWLLDVFYFVLLSNKHAGTLNVNDTKMMRESLLAARQLLKRPLLIGMVHVDALPGTPLNTQHLTAISKRAVWEATAYAAAGLDGLIVENMNDIPYIKEESTEPHVVAAMTRICGNIKDAVHSVKDNMLLGVQILAARNREALAVAFAVGYHFIRAEGFVFAHVADEGWMDGCAGQLLRYRKNIGAHDVSILTDINKKHCSHSVTADLSLETVAEGAEFFLSDGLIITGTKTGESARPDDLKKVRVETALPVLVGSGLTETNMETFWAADGFVVGSHFKYDGKWQNRLDRKRLQLFVQKMSDVATLRNGSL